MATDGMIPPLATLHWCCNLQDYQYIQQDLNLVFLPTHICVDKVSSDYLRTHGLHHMHRPNLQYRRCLAMHSTLILLASLGWRTQRLVCWFQFDDLGSFYNEYLSRRTNAGCCILASQEVEDALEKESCRRGCLPCGFLVSQYFNRRRYSDLG